MPIYTYICPECREKFNQHKAMLDSPLEACPVCGFEGELGRVFDVPGITFRGSGFYHTDKKINEITDPEYQLTPAEQIEYYDEKLRHGDDRKIRVFT